MKKQKGEKALQKHAPEAWEEVQRLRKKVAVLGPEMANIVKPVTSGKEGLTR